MNGTNGLIPGLYAGLGVVLGHNFPFYMGFKGGKGIASSVGVIFCISILLSSVSYVIGLLVIYISRFVSLGAILILLSFLIMLLCLKYPLEVLFLDAMLTLLAIYQHRHNIRRLVKGQENKFIMNKK
jgi:glycerol-3-phosphate acyltransferase PlsY